MDDQNKSMNERWAPPTDRGERGYATDPGFASGAEYTSRPDYGTTSPIDEEAPEQRTAEIRGEIDQTRAEMSETIDAIQDRLRPGNIASRAAESVKDATVGRVKEFAGDLTGRGNWRGDRDDDDWRYQSYGPPDGAGGNSVLDHIRRNPMAAAMAAGSIAWLFLGNRGGGPRRNWSQDDRWRGMYGSQRRGDNYGDQRSFEHPDGSHGYYDYGGGVRGGMRAIGSDRSRDWSESGREMADRAREAASDTGERMKQGASTIQRRTRHFASDSPFAAGAIAAAVGLAIGLAIPETERENEMLGEARDSMIDRGKEAVRTAAERVQTAAGEVQRVAGDALKGIAPGGSSDDGNQTQQNQSSASQSAGKTGATGTSGTAGMTGGTGMAGGTGISGGTGTTGMTGTSATESAVPGMQAGSGGTGATPTTKGQTGKTRTR